MSRLLVALVLSLAPIPPLAQEPPGPTFEVVAIRRNTAGGAAASATRLLPDGSLAMINSTIVGIIRSVADQPIQVVRGLPSWVETERYDINAKAPEGGAREQSRLMIRNMLVERFKLAAHLEQEERAGFALVTARRDARLGPNLTLAPEGCGASADTSAEERQHKCGVTILPGSMKMGATTMKSLAQSLGAIVGAPVVDRTGLGNLYAMTLRYSLAKTRSPNPVSVPDDLPDVFVALSEQLGLKLQPEKTTASVLVVDHIERPTEE